MTTSRLGFITKEWLAKRIEELKLDGMLAHRTINDYIRIVGKPFDKMSTDELNLYKIAFQLGREFELDKINNAAHRRGEG